MAIAEISTDDAIVAARPTRGSRFAWMRAFRHGGTLVGLIVTSFFIVLAIIGPYIAPYDPAAVSYDYLQPPSAAHWFGTTQTGQDVFSQVLEGARISVVVGVAAAVIAVFLSILVGITAGFLGGVTDDLLSMLANIFLVIPSLPLTVILIAYLPRSGSLGVTLVIAITGWAWGARVLRSQTLSLRRRDFVEAARATGERTSAIIFRDILPNQLAIIAASFLGTVTGAILAQAGIAFLGLADVTEYSWGTILYWAQTSNALLGGAWWWFVPAGLAIALLGTGLSLVNFGIDEFINPRLRLAGIGTRRAQRAMAKRPRVKKAPGTRVIRGAAAPFTQESSDVLLEVRGLRVEYGSEHASTVAVNDVSFSLRRGEVIGIAGESGSGKSTLAYAITRLHKPPASITAGQLLYTRADGTVVDVLGLSEEELRRFRWEELSIVFQSAMNALNPIMKIGEQIDDVLRAHRPDMPEADRKARVIELLDLVGIREDRVNAYPHELSGGMRQRAMIAIGLALDPEVIVMDEPTTALDVVIQRQIVEKIMELKDRLGFAVIFITHDLSLLIELSDTIAVMYAGRIVEIAEAQEFYRRPAHPYSRGLLGSFPTLGGERRELTGIPGSPPDLRALPSGCAFAPRCPLVQDRCRVAMPPLTKVAVEIGMRPTEARCVIYETSDSSERVVEAV
ncbi:dipeptide/oligopeptide/nickel ABC transporter permease/ATP-binding protein [Microbacterium aoyamense]|uniref:Dipeptide/oligopeptide/nickel ABC transporter permease/ATP-binding protein n=1 Tax=Microbacterium aoyamense TaxID=344166 RepID=A0ABN2PZF5_9MICO|nr:dipeptide/oligopeptide/nickel ABC transporter permease/ATP-binding protein [Microbacterium aoyamense]